MPDAPSSPPRGEWGSTEEELSYYKTQYETLEVELQEFQASSKELEAELEKDIEESEKRERKLKERLESLGFEVDEWKTKYKQSKSEANNAQNTLQKEITVLREAQRSLNMQLRDTEVQNDDLERQGRNQTSSLEDLESKYNVAIERTVMQEEEIKIGEQERENLRIENQRLRDELSDLRIEAEIVQEKLRLAEQTIEGHHQRKTSHLLAGDSLRPRSPMSETSTAATELSSPTAASTPPRTKGETVRHDTTPPSPPLSDAPIAKRPVPSTPMPTRKTSIARDPSATPRAGLYSSRGPRHSRGPSISVSAKTAATPSGRTTPSIRTTAPSQRTSRPSVGAKTPGAPLPRSGSLYQIRNLIGNMQKLEARVHNVRSRLPAPTTTPPRASPRNASALGHHMPSSVTVRRSTTKRTSQASTSSAINPNGDTGVSRLSFGVARETSRPSSRASLQRPPSRSSTRTTLGHYANTSVSGIEGRIPRPRSSMSGPVGHGHSHSMSLSSSVRDDSDTYSDSLGSVTPLPRRTSTDKSGIPTPSGLPRRQSGARRSSATMMDHGMLPPARPRKMSQVEESF